MQFSNRVLTDGIVEIKRKFRQRSAAWSAHNSAGSNWRLPMIVTASRGTPARSNASPTDKNVEPLRPGPSSTTRNCDPAETLSWIHRFCSALNSVAREYGCPVGRTVILETDLPLAHREA